MFVMMVSLFALTGSLTATTLTVVVATLLSKRPSFTVTWKVRVSPPAPTAGAVNEGVPVVAPVSSTGAPSVWSQL